MDAKPINVSAADFQREVIDSGQPVVVDFWAPWCGPCRMIGPVLEELAAQHAGRVKVAKINVDEERELAGRFRISGIPTLKVFRKGQEAGEIVGFAGRKPMEELFDQLAGLGAAPSAEVATA